MEIRNTKPAMIGIGSFLAASLGVSVSASIDEDSTNLFLAEALGDANNVLTSEEEEGECGEGKCGEDGEDSEGECGEGKCGEDGEDSDDDEGEDSDDDEDSEEE